MNYYERHLGDYARDTAHLSLLEHGVYTLLLDRYYATEAGIPADQAHRLARARSRDERAAVDAVLEEFFALVDGVWTNRRVEEEIAKAATRIEAARSNGRRGGRPRENPVGYEEKPNGFSLGSKTKTQQKAHQTPDTSITPDTSQALTDPKGPTDAGRACLLMRQSGCVGTNPSHPDLLAALAEGVTPETLAATVAEGIESGKARPFAWAITTARGRHAHGAATISAGATHATDRKLSAVERVEANIERNRRERGDPIAGAARLIAG